MVNNYGSGGIPTDTDTRTLKEDYNFYRKNSKNIVCIVKNDKSKEQGLARLIRDEKEKEFTDEEIREFNIFLKKTLIWKGKEAWNATKKISIVKKEKTDIPSLF